MEINTEKAQSLNLRHFAATRALGSTLFSAAFKAGDDLKWPQSPSGDTFLFQLQKEHMVTRHLSEVPEVDGMSSGCSSHSPGSSSDVPQLYGKAWAVALATR